LLAEALASVREQSFTDYEVIVVSNGESEAMRARSRAVAARYGAAFFELPDGNLPAARNFAIERAAGDWIAFLDDDDVWLPHKLARQLAEADRTGADMIASRFVEFYPDSREAVGGWRVPAGWTYIQALCHQRWGVPPSCVIVRSAILRAVGGFDPEQRLGEDGDLWRRISWRHRIHQMEEPLVRYRRGHGSMTQGGRSVRYDLRVLLKMLRDTPVDLRWAVPSRATLARRWLLRTFMPGWLRHPRKHLLAVQGGAAPKLASVEYDAVRREGETMPAVSVVVPTHNRPEMLAEALASIRAQTFTDYEIIVVSNGESPDMRAQSQAVSRRAGASWFGLDTGNVSTARNFGVEQAAGKWIAFLDDDDIWLAEKLERQVEATRRTGADMIACGFVRFYPDGREMRETPRLPEGCAYVKALSHLKWGTFPSAVLVRKSVLTDVGGFDPHLPFNQDNDLWRRISWRHAIHQVDAVLVRYRMGHSSVSRNHWGHFQDLRHSLKMYRDTPPDLRWALLSPLTLGRRWLLRAIMPSWLRQPKHSWLRFRRLLRRLRTRRRVPDAVVRQKYLRLCAGHDDRTESNSTVRMESECHAPPAANTGHRRFRISRLASL
jgi:glycosyltransferase involved in cell wall biosynthesis